MGETNLEFLVLIRYVQHPQRHVLSCQGGLRDERKFSHFDVYDVLIGICKEGAEAIGHSQYAMPYILSQWASEVLRELTVTIVASRLVVRRNESLVIQQSPTDPRSAMPAARDTSSTLPRLVHRRSGYRLNKAGSG
jgi:hypothetical protein